MPVDWESVARALAARLVATGVKAAENGVDSVLEDIERGLDSAFDEGKRRIKQARGRIPNRTKKNRATKAAAAGVKEEPKVVVIDAEIIDDTPRNK